MSVKLDRRALVLRLRRPAQRPPSDRGPSPSRRGRRCPCCAIVVRHGQADGVDAVVLEGVARVLVAARTQPAKVPAPRPTISSGQLVDLSLKLIAEPSSCGSGAQANAAVGPRSVTVTSWQTVSVRAVVVGHGQADACRRRRPWKVKLGFWTDAGVQRHPNPSPSRRSLSGALVDASLKLVADALVLRLRLPAKSRPSALGPSTRHVMADGVGRAVVVGHGQADGVDAVVQERESSGSGRALVPSPPKSQAQVDDARPGRWSTCR